MLTPRGEQIAALIVGVESGPVSPNQSIDVDTSASVNPAVANQILYGGPTGPIAPTNVNSGQSLTVTVTSIQSGSGSNIQGFFPGASMAFSGLWKFTALIKAGDRGKSTSICWQGGTVFDSAVAAAKSWAKFLADTFGNEGAYNDANFGMTAASPYIRSLRVMDALNPRLGSLVKLPTGQIDYCGRGTDPAGSNQADFISTALSLRFTGTTTETVPPPVNIAHQIVYANHALLGIPDRVVTGGDQIDTSQPVGVQTFSYWAGLYIQWVLNPANALGCITTRIQEVPFQCSNFNRPVDKLWQFTTSNPHGYNSGDRIRLTKCNAPFFAGSYKVNVLDPVTLAINNGPPATVAPPTTGVCRRFMDSNGVRLGVFAQFSLPAGQTADPWNLAVSKRNPARPPSLVSFRKRPRRPH